MRTLLPRRGRHSSRRGLHRALLALTVVLVAATGCGSSDATGSGEGDRVRAAPDGYAEEVKAETDQLAEQLLPALVTSLGARVTPGRAGFVECDISGWRYEGDVDLFLPPGSDPSAVPGQVTAVMEELGLTIEPRDDADTVLGSRGRLSALLGQAAGPEPRPFRHLTLSHECTAYSDADTAVAESTEKRDYASVLPAGAVYSPAG